MSETIDTGTEFTNGFCSSFDDQDTKASATTPAQGDGAEDGGAGAAQGPSALRRLVGGGVGDQVQLGEPEGRQARAITRHGLIGARAVGAG